MKDIMIQYKTEILLAASFLYMPFVAFLVSLGTVYLLGRMLDIVKTARAKNALATISMLGVYAFYFCVYAPAGTWTQRVWQILVYLSISIVFYVLLGFKLYERVDSLLDRTVGKDSDEPVHGPKKLRSPVFKKKPTMKAK